MMTEDEIAALLVEHADDDGNVSDEVMAKIISGEYEPGEIKGESLDPDAEADDTPVEQDPVEAKADEPEGDAEPEPVILAKDGKHTIPYSELAQAREEAKSAAEQLAVLQAKLQEQTELLGKVQEAKESDEDTGTTEAMDDLMADLAEDYPGAAKLIQKLTSQLEQMTSKQQALEAAETAKTAALTAQQQFDKAVTELNPEYPTVKDSDAFWAWFDKQPSYIRAAANSGDPQIVADVVSTYVASAKPGDTGKPAGKAPTAAEALAKAKERAAVSSLSDVPGGSNPAHDEIDAIKALSAMEMAGRFDGKDPAQIEAILARIL